MQKNSMWSIVQFSQCIQWNEKAINQQGVCVCVWTVEHDVSFIHPFIQIVLQKKAPLCYNSTSTNPHRKLLYCLSTPLSSFNRKHLQRKPPQEEFFITLSKHFSFSGAFLNLIPGYYIQSMPVHSQYMSAIHPASKTWTSLSLNLKFRLVTKLPTLCFPTLTRSNLINF